MSTSLPVSTGAISCYTLLRWWTLSGSLTRKMFIVSALSSMVSWNQVSRDPKNQQLRKRCLLCTVVLEGVKVKQSTQVCKSDHFGHFCGYNGKTLTVYHQRTRWSSPSKQGSGSATVSTGCDKPVCTCSTLWRRHYVTTSKEYLINCHILLKYFELVFLQLQLIKISWKLVII